MSLRLGVTLAIGLLLFVLLMILFFYLLYRKWRDGRIERRKRLWLNMLEQEDAEFIFYESSGVWPRLLIPRRTDHFEALEQLISHRMKLEQHATELQRIVQFADRYFVPLYKERLRNGTWSARMNTLLYIEMFQMRILLDDLLELLKKKNCTERERYIIYRILAGFQYEGIQQVIQFAAGQVPDHVIRQMLYPLPYTLLEDYVINFDSFPLSIGEHVLDVLRVRNERSESLLELLEKLLVSEHRELRIKALKGLTNFGFMTEEGLSDLGTKVDVWRSRHWTERLMLVRLMGHIRDVSFLPLLDHFIGDESYLVRSEAATSIWMYRGGRERLLEISMRHADKFAREMAAERLELDEYGRA
jgi:hypothetical protein